LVNLIMHCVRRGEGKTTVRVSNAEGGVVTWIGAPGSNLSSAEKREMFEPYAQLHEKPVGYGLGLALAQAVVQMHGGKIWLEDLPSGGVAFAFQLGAASPGQEHGVAPPGHAVRGPKGRAG
jgi:signal transduction histidine kinase